MQCAGRPGFPAHGKDWTCIGRERKGKVVVMVNAKTVPLRAAEKSRELAAWFATRAATVVKSTKGQGTTEYAILVGVLVVIAILAIMVFRPKLQELWNAIAEGINGL